MSSSLRFTFWVRFFGEARSTVFLHIYTHFTILWLHKSLLVTQRDVRGGTPASLIHIRHHRPVRRPVRPPVPPGQRPRHRIALVDPDHVRPLHIIEQPVDLGPPVPFVIYDEDLVTADGICHVAEDRRIGEAVADSAVQHEFGIGDVPVSIFAAEVRDRHLPEMLPRILKTYLLFLLERHPGLRDLVRDLKHLQHERQFLFVPRGLELRTPVDIEIDAVDLGVSAHVAVGAGFVAEEVYAAFDFAPAGALAALRVEAVFFALDLVDAVFVEFPLFVVKVVVLVLFHPLVFRGGGDGAGAYEDGEEETEGCQRGRFQCHSVKQ